MRVQQFESVLTMTEVPVSEQLPVLTAEERRKQRLERFGSQLDDEQKKKLRQEKFGTVLPGDAKKKREERFGTTQTAAQVGNCCGLSHLQG